MFLDGGSTPLLLTNWARQIGQEIGGSSSACGTPTGTTNAIRTTYEPKIFSIHFWIIDLLSFVYLVCLRKRLSMWSWVYICFHSVCLYFLFVYFDFLAYNFAFVNPFRFHKGNILMDHPSFWISLVPKYSLFLDSLHLYFYVFIYLCILQCSFYPHFVYLLTCHCHWFIYYSIFGVYLFTVCVFIYLFTHLSIPPLFRYVLNI